MALAYCTVPVIVLLLLLLGGGGGISPSFNCNSSFHSF